MPAPELATIESAYRLHDRAVALLGRGAFMPAESTARRALAELTHRLGASHPDVAGACQTLGTILLTRGSHAEAAACTRRALRILSRLPAGGEDVESLRVQTRSLLACVHRDQ